MDIKVRETDATPSEDPSTTVSPVTPVIKKSTVDRHAEMRKRGEEKRRLLAALKPAVASNDAVDENATVPLFVMDTVKATPAPTLVNVKKAKLKRDTTKLVSLFKDADVVKTTLDPSKPTISTKHSDHKRQKMRTREKEKREKLRVKKEEKAEKRVKRRDNHPKFNEVIDRPSDSIKELGLKLAEKLKKESGALHAAYEAIGKNRKIDV